MLSDFEDDIGDDLPAISLSQSTGEKSETEMPPAAEVASERARRAAAEQALRELREPLPQAAPAPTPAAPAPDDGEAELVEAWLELRVDGGGGAGGDAGVAGGDARARLVRGLRARLAAGAGGGAGVGAALLDAWLRACEGGPNGAAAATEQMLSGIILGLKSAGVAKGTVAAAAWLLGVACTGGGGGGGGRVRRALHELLDAHATCDQIEELVSVAAPALLEAGGAALLLAAHDAVRSGGGGRSGAGAGADRLAAALLEAALTAALPPQGEEMECSGGGEGAGAGAGALARRARGRWRGLAARAQLLLLRGAARALAVRPDQDLLQALAQPLPRSQDPLARQQVLSNVSKLQLLFRERANGGGAGGRPELHKDDATAESGTEPKGEVVGENSAESGTERLAPAPAEAELKGELLDKDYSTANSAESGTEGAGAGAGVKGEARAASGTEEPEPEPKRLRRSPRARAASRV